MLRVLRHRQSVLNIVDWRQLYSPCFTVDDGTGEKVEDRLDNAAGGRICSRTSWSPVYRRYCVVPEHGVYDPNKAVSAANKVLQQIAVRKLCAKLEEESRTRLTMPVDEVLALTQEMVNVNEADSIALLRALQTSGNILQHGRYIYLRPHEVAEIILQAIPDTEEEAKRKCQEIEKELQPLQQEFERKIERKAKLRSAVLAYAGLGLLLAQFAFFVRIVYWDLSWDVVEPLTFFNSQLTAILAYTYFLVYRHDFTAESHYKAVINKEKTKLIQQHRFDYERYHVLLQDLERWKRFAKSIATR